jgi:hypothetical protein
MNEKFIFHKETLVLLKLYQVPPLYNKLFGKESFVGSFTFSLSFICLSSLVLYPLLFVRSRLPANFSPSVLKCALALL